MSNHATWSQTTAAATSLTSASTNAAQSTTFTLDVTAASTQDASLTVQSPSHIPLKIIHGGDPASGNATLDVSPFINDQGVVQSFTVSVGGAAPSDHVTNLAFKDPVVTVDLNVPPKLSPGSKYTGRLILTVAGQAQPLVWRLQLTAAGEPRPATLVVNRNAVTLQGVRSIFCWVGYCSSPPTVTVEVWDKTGNFPLNAVTARLEASPGATSADFDQAKIAATTFDGRETDIFTTPLSGVIRDVAPHRQVPIKLVFDGNIPAGEYTIPLRFTAENSGDDDLQRLIITLKVRNSVASAIMVLLLAAIVSFVATRWVTMQRQRAALLTRVHALRPSWLKRDSQTLAVIGLRATLKLVEDLCGRRWLTGQQEIDSRLTEAARMLAILDRVRQIRGRINAIPVQLVRERATWKLDDFAGQFGSAPLRQEDVAPLNTQLDKFDDWCASGTDKQKAMYWADVEAHIEECVTRTTGVTDPEAIATDRAFRDELARETKQPPTQLPDMIRIDVISRRLGLLWEAREHDDWVQEMVRLHPLEMKSWAPIEQVYRVIDNGRWALLTQPANFECKVAGPPDSSLDRPEAYETVVFSVDLVPKQDKDKDLLNTYLVQKKLTYDWTIVVDGMDLSPWYGPIAEPATLHVRSTEPRIAQFSPSPGSLSVSVGIGYLGAAVSHVPDVQSTRVRFDPSSDFRAWSIMRHADLIGSVLALLVSVVSGIKMFALTARFGSLTDYLALFTWGASLDQGKNFLQSLAIYSPETSAAQPATPPAAPSAPDAKPEGAKTA